MSERGVMGVAVLWILGAVSALAFSVIALGKWHQAHGRHQMAQVKLISLAQMAVLLEQDAEFDAASRDREFETGKVHLERTFTDNKTVVQLKGKVECGRDEKQFEMEWKRMGGMWRATYWREL